MPGPYLIRNGNRIPETVVLTHAHLDHTLSLDWIYQCFFRKHRKQKKLHLYCTEIAWDFVLASFPQMEELAVHEVLLPGVNREIGEIPGLSLISLPECIPQGFFLYTNDFNSSENFNLPFSVFDFCNRIRPEKTMLVHYSGMEDRNCYPEDILTPVQLKNWSNTEAESRKIPSSFIVSIPGDLYSLG